MLNRIKVKVVLIVVVRALVVIQIRLQLRLHLTILRLRAGHGIVLTEVGSGDDRRSGRGEHCRAGANPSRQQDQNHQASSQPSKDLFVLGDKVLDLIRRFLSDGFSGGLGGGGGRLRPGLASRSVFLLDVLLLVVLIHIGTGSLHLRVFGDRLLKMELPISGLGLLLQLGHLLERLVCTALCVMLVVADNGLGGNLCLMGGFHTGVFLLNLMDFAVNARGKSIADLTDGLVCLKLQFALSLGDFQLVFKVEAGFAFTGFLVKDALFFQHLLGGQLLTGGIQTLMRLLRFSLQPFNPPGSWGIAVKVRHLCEGFRRSFQNGLSINLPFSARPADLAGDSGIGKCFSVVNGMGAVCLRVQSVRCGIIADG